MRKRAAQLALLGLATVANIAGADELPHLGVFAMPLVGHGSARLEWAIYLDGHIDAGAPARVAGVVALARIERAAVYFNSPGGSLVAAMDLGRLLREHGFDTSVGRRTADASRPDAGVCYSACPFAYAGGVRRSLAGGSVLGVHRAENRTPVPDEQAFVRRVADEAGAYLEEMGVSTRLVALMAGAPHDSIRLIDPDEALHLDLVNGT